ncbi:MAG: hypothetical protein KKD39_01425 [Candidatus Altiarchaeota archaeon]|nr:hypothetical protein [Candidatus Altiarchaeota archaeon]
MNKGKVYLADYNRVTYAPWELLGYGFVGLSGLWGYCVVFRQYLKLPVS